MRHQAQTLGAAEPLSCIQIVASVSDPAAGPSYSVRRLCSELVQQGARVSLFTVRGWREGLAKTSSASFVGHTAYDQDFRGVPGLSRLCFSHELRNALFQQGGQVQLLHTHGLWLMPNIYPSRAAKRLSKPLIISPRGMLGREALQFSHRKKLALWYAAQRAAVQSASCLHATSEKEYQDIRAFGVSNPVAVIPNGIDMPTGGHGSIRRTRWNGSERVVLALGRVHPKKGLDRLLTAWARIEERRSGMEAEDRRPGRTWPQS